MSSRSTPRLPLLSLLVVAALLLPTVAPALAQESPFNPLPSAPATQATTQTTATTTSTSTSDGGLSTLQSALIVIGGVALLTGIALYIVRDARRNAPISKGESEAATIDPDSHAQRRRAKQKQRARQKAARAQRRRNR